MGENFQWLNQSEPWTQGKDLELCFLGSLHGLLLESGVGTSSSCARVEPEKPVGCRCPSCHGHPPGVVQRSRQLPAAGWRWGKGLDLAFPPCDGSRRPCRSSQDRAGRRHVPFGFWQRSRRLFQRWNKAGKKALELCCEGSSAAKYN